ncbi:MAG: pitrilysin family protein [Elusimicrobiota bacterium]
MTLVFSCILLLAGQCQGAALKEARSPERGRSPLAQGGARPNMAKQPKVGTAKRYQAPAPQRFSISNGLAVVLVEDHRFPLVTARLAVGGGAVYTAGREPGFAEALAGLLTEGTASRSAKQIAEEADAFGGSVEAEAAPDHYVLHAHSLAESAGRMFALLAEVAAAPSFPAEEVELRKRNMLSELQVQRSDPDFLAEVAIYRKVFNGHPYGSIAPTEASIGRITREQLDGLHERLFVPSNALLVVVGDATREKLQALLEQAFAAWTAPISLPMWPVPAPQAGPAGIRVAVLDRPGSSQSVLRVGSLAVTEKDPDYFPMLLANQVLGGSFAARLMQDLREKRGYTYGAYSGVSVQRSGACLMVSAAVRTEATAESVAAVLDHMGRMAREKVTDSELATAKAVIVGRFVRRLETQDGLADAVLLTRIHDLPEDFLDRFVERVQAVTREQVLKAASRLMAPEKAWAAVIGDLEKIGKSLEKVSKRPLVKVDQNGDDVR